MDMKLFGRIVIMCLTLVMARHAVADRSVRSLSGSGWTANGEAVSIPHCWNGVDGASGGFDPSKSSTSCSAESYARKAVRYERDLPDPTAGKRQFIRFGGASINAIVRVNGCEVGRHAGAFTAFCFELTGKLRPHGNRVEIVVDNNYDATVPPIVGDFTMFGGLYRDVEWIETDPICIDPCVNAGPGVEIMATASGHVTVRTFVSGAASAKIAYRICGQTYTENAFDVPGVVPWTPENPQLYDLEIVLEQDGSRDTIRQAIGFRDAEFRADGFYLNGVRRQIRGVCRHQDQDGKGWALSPEDELTDARWIKRMGADGVRCVHYPQSSHWHDLCDRMGLMAWCEVPFVNELELSDAFVSNMTVVAREMVAQHRNHPAIVCWGLFNELYSGSKHGPGTFEPLIGKIADEIRAADPTRKIVAASNQLGMKSLNRVPDHVAFNIYPGWYNHVDKWYTRQFGHEDTQIERLLVRLREVN